MAFRTSDLYLAACICSLEVPLVELERSGQRCFFVFDDRAKAIERDWTYRKLRVEPCAFSDNIRRLKSAVHSTPEKPK